MAIVFGTILVIIFLLLAGVHIYWAFGGQWGNDAVTPVKDGAAKAIMPGVLPTIAVALGLLAFALFVLIKASIVGVVLPAWLSEYGLWIIAGIFIVRAIGEFNYVGFFKKSRPTKFARNDTKYYSPLCLVICILAILLLVAS